MVLESRISRLILKGDTSLARGITTIARNITAIHMSGVKIIKKNITRR